MRKIRLFFPYYLFLISLGLAGCIQNNVIATDADQTATTDVAVITTTAPTIDTPTPTPLPTSAFTEASNALGGVRVHLWHALAGGTAARLEEFETEFNRTNTWGIWLEVTGYPDEGGMDAALQAVWGSMDQPEVVIAAPEDVMAWDTSLENLVDLMPYINDPEWGITQEEQDDYLETFWSAETDEIKRWGLPAMGSLQVMFYNLTWAEELGYTSLPATAADFKTQTCAAAVAIMNDNDLANDGTGGWMVDLDPTTVVSWIQAFGGDVEANPSGQYRFNNAETEVAFEYLKGAYDNGCFWYARKSDQAEYLADREAIAVAGNLELGATLSDTMTLSGNQDAWKILPFPGENGAGNVSATSYGYHLLQAAPADRLAGWLVVKWLSQPEKMGQVAEAGWRLPVRSTALEALQNDTGKPEALKEAASLLDEAHLTPGGTGWEIAQPVLQDAYRQLFQADTTTDGIPTILTDLDLMIEELEGRPE